MAHEMTKDLIAIGDFFFTSEEVQAMAKAYYAVRPCRANMKTVCKLLRPVFPTAGLHDLENYIEAGFEWPRKTVFDSGDIVRCMNDLELIILARAEIGPDYMYWVQTIGSPSHDPLTIRKGTPLKFVQSDGWFRHNS